MSRRLVLAVLGAATVGLAIYGTSLLSAPSDPTDPAAAADTPPPTPRARDDRRAPSSADRDADRDALALALRTRLERALDAPEQDEEPPLPPSESRVEAETAFDVVMEQLEAYADQDAPLGRTRKGRLYRAANDAFSALTNQLDPKNKADMQALEDAHVRMKAMLSELDIAPPRPAPAPPEH